MSGRKIFGWLVGLGLLIQVSACREEQQSGTGDGTSIQQEHGEGQLPESEDALSVDHFLNEAIQSNQLEIELSRLAVQKGETDRVKNLAQKMIEEHSLFDQKIKALANQKGVNITQDKAAHQSIITRLEGMQGMHFDQEFLKELEASHSRTVELYEDAAERVQDAEIQNFAARHLPTLKAHHALADHGKDMIQDQRRSPRRGH